MYCVINNQWLNQIQSCLECYLVRSDISGDLWFWENETAQIFALHFTYLLPERNFLSVILVEKQIISFKLRVFGIQGDLCLFVPCYFKLLPYTMTICSTKYHHPCQPCHTILNTTYDLPSYALQIKPKTMMVELPVE